MGRWLPPVVVVVALAAPAAGQVEVTPRIGFDFDHFGESYRISDDQDTVSTINDYGTVLGLSLATPRLRADRLRLDADVHIGRQTNRFRLDFDARKKWGDNSLELEHDGAYRTFSSGGDYSVAGNYLQDFVRLTWERRLTESVRLRLRDSFDVTWYADPNEYNLSSTLHRPGADLRFLVGDMNEVRVGYRWGQRSVPDSTTLDYRRHTADFDVNLLFGWTTSLDLSTRIERRTYDEASVRESFWEARTDLAFEFGVVDRASFRLLHENEVLRHDDPDELDFDSNWARTGFQVEVHRTRNMDLSIMPLYTYLSSSTAPEEEYAETGLELGINWRIGEGTWIDLAYEIGRRDYEVSSVDGDASGSGTDDILSDLEADLLFGTIFSDYIYNRITLLVSADVSHGISVNLFANWQPEDHHVSQDDTETRIVSGGVDYRF